MPRWVIKAIEQYGAKSITSKSDIDTSKYFIFFYYSDFLLGFECWILQFDTKDKLENCLKDLNSEEDEEWDWYKLGIKVVAKDNILTEIAKHTDVAKNIKG